MVEFGSCILRRYTCTQLALICRICHAVRQTVILFMSEKHHAVYRISGGAVQTVTAVQFSTDCDQHGRSSAMAGGLKCSLGHKMEFVSASSNGRVCHFRHSTDKKRKAGEAPVPVQCNGCSMSSEHVEAQDLLQRNIHRIHFQTWKDCGVCATGFFGPAQHATAKLEVPLRVEGRAIRADVAVYLGSRLVRTIEVKHTHATDVATRGDVPCLEVDARHVIDQCTRTATGIVTLKGTVASKQKCTEYCAAYENALDEFHKEIIRRAADNQKWADLGHVQRCFWPIRFRGRTQARSTTLVSRPLPCRLQTLGNQWVRTALVCTCLPP